jgi:hypothetical protein
MKKVEESIGRKGVGVAALYLKQGVMEGMKHGHGERDAPGAVISPLSNIYLDERPRDKQRKPDDSLCR